MNSRLSRLFFASLALACAAPAFADLVDASALHGKKLLYVAGAPDKDRPNEDALVVDHLKSLGFEVTPATDTDPASRAGGQDLVVISSSVDPDVLKGAYRASPVPVLTWSAYSYPYLAMTGPELHKDFELIDPARFPGRAFSLLYGWCVDPTNPIMKAAGVPRTQNFGTYYLLATDCAWGRPTRAATTVATIEGDDDHGILFTYERGSSMYGDIVAPARRVGFFLGSNNFQLLSQAYGPGETDPRTRTWYVGLKLFDASLRWAVSPPPPAPTRGAAALKAALSQAAAGKKALFVLRKHAFEGKEADDHMVAHLGELGFKVTVADQDDDDQEMAKGQDLVMISASCSKYKLANRYTDLKVPFILFDPLMTDSYGFAGRRRYKEFGPHGEVGESEDPLTHTINIVGAPSILAAGLPAGPVRMIHTADVIGWATPGRAALVIATFPTNPEQCPIFGYEKGATLANGRVNPARRLFFALDNNAFDDLTEEGRELWDAGVLWTVGGTP